MKNWFNISCHKATYLISKKQEDCRISMVERLQLSIHLFICDVCKLFRIQTNYIIKNIHQHHQAETLTDDAKEKIACVVKEEIAKS
jgi:hypothetical protein